MKIHKILGILVIIMFSLYEGCGGGKSDATKLSKKHLNLLSVEDINKVTGNDRKLEKEANLSPDGKEAIVRFFPYGSPLEFIAYRIEKIDDLKKDYEENLMKCKETGYEIEEIDFLGWGGIEYEVTDREGHPKVIFFWNEKEKLRINLVAYDISMREAEELARIMDRKLR
ncbi:hypothetical protein DRQ20_01245 [bacterium]|nr:MAG: hypothetical protein DRQ20_01245 [bacterium]